MLTSRRITTTTSTRQNQHLDNSPSYQWRWSCCFVLLCCWLWLHSASRGWVFFSATEAKNTAVIANKLSFGNVEDDSCSLASSFGTQTAKKEQSRVHCMLVSVVTRSRRWSHLLCALRTKYTPRLLALLDLNTVRGLWKCVTLKVWICQKKLEDGTTLGLEIGAVVMLKKSSNVFAPVDQNCFCHCWNVSCWNVFSFGSVFFGIEIVTNPIMLHVCLVSVSFCLLLKQRQHLVKFGTAFIVFFFCWDSCSKKKHLRKQNKQTWYLYIYPNPGHGHTKNRIISLLSRLQRMNLRPRWMHWRHWLLRIPSKSLIMPNSLLTKAIWSPQMPSWLRKFSLKEVQLAPQDNAVNAVQTVHLHQGQQDQQYLKVSMSLTF